MTFADARVTQTRKDFDDDWPLFVVWTAVIAIVLVGAIRVFQAALLGSERALLAWIAVIPGSILAAACIGVMIWVFWTIHRLPGEPRPYVVALLTVTATILFCTEAFAGITTLLSERGVVGAYSDGEATLWSAEQRYLWDLANAIPLVDAPQTVGWQKPEGFADRGSGTVLLLFKILVLVPLVQVAIAGYRLVEARWLAAGETQGHWHRLLRFSSTSEVLALFIVFLVMSVGAYVALVLVGEPTSVVDRWASEHLAGGVNGFGVNISLSSLQTAADCLVAAGILGIAWSALSELGEEGLLRLRSFGTLACALCGYLALLALATLIAAGTTLALLHADLVQPQPMIPPQRELDAALEWHAWSVAEAIPFLDMPASLDWSLRYRFVDSWSGAILLALKLFVFFILLVPVTWMVRAVVHRLRPNPRPQLDAFGDLSGLLVKANSDLDDVQARILANTLRAESEDDENVYPWVVAARRRIGGLKPALERTRDLFGGGDVSEAADAAVVATVARLECVEQYHWTPRSHDEVRRNLEESRTNATREAADFTALATVALHKAAEHSGDGSGKRWADPART